MEDLTKLVNSIKFKNDIRACAKGSKMMLVEYINNGFTRKEAIAMLASMLGSQSKEDYN